MERQLLIDLAASVALFSLMAYAVLGGADFGGGIWDLCAWGPRKKEQRAAISQAMGPIWEANHVWLIFSVVCLFTAFPAGYAALSRALFVPFHLAIIGIMLRGAAFAFRSHTGQIAPHSNRFRGALSWGAVFGVASVVSPFLLGACFGTLTDGSLAEVSLASELPLAEVRWLNGYTFTCGLLALATCAYLAAVYLTVETAGQGELCEDFRSRALVAGVVTSGLALIVQALAYLHARWFFDQLTAWRSWPILLLALTCFLASFWEMSRRRYHQARTFAIIQIVTILLGWALAQRPYFIYPHIKFEDVAAPTKTLEFLLLTVPIGAALLGPSMWFLMTVFKTSPEAAAGSVKR